MKSITQFIPNSFKVFYFAFETTYPHRISNVYLRGEYEYFREKQ